MNTIQKTKARFQSLFQRKPNRFLVRLLEQSEIVVQGTQALIDYMESRARRMPLSYVNTKNRQMRSDAS